MGVSTLASAMPPFTPPRLRPSAIKYRIAQPNAPFRPAPTTMDEACSPDNHGYDPLPLRHVKALFLHQQYRQCVQACQQHLLAEPDMKQRAPLRYAFVYFYLAMAHEETARLMDTTSKVKLNAFDLAEKCYHDALAALPAAESARQHNDEAQGLHDNANDLAFSQRPCSPIDDFTLSSFPLPGSFTPKSSTSPLTHVHDGDLPELSDSESQASFGDLLTPTRVLDRPISRSFIATPTKHFHHARPRSFCAEQVSSLPRTTSNMSVFHTSTQQGLPRTTSHSLLRPVRLGSPAKPYAQHHPVPSKNRGRRSRLPKPTSPGRPLSGVCETIDEDESISPLGPAELTTASTLSPVSSVSSFNSDFSGPYGSDQSFAYDSLSDLEAMHIQILTHLRILDKVRQEAIEAQAICGLAETEEDDTTPAPLPISQNRHARTSGLNALSEHKNSPTSREDRQKRILAGRERKWTRERFDPSRYVMLAENALAEL